MYKTDLSVELCGITFKNPIIAASGTFGFGREYEKFYPLSELGGISLKGLTRDPRLGNPPPRIAETPSGMLNSVGLQNPGVEEFVRSELPYLQGKGTVLIANVAGSTMDDYAENCRIVSDGGIDMIELNLSCPNVKAGAMAFGADPKSVFEATALAKKNSRVPVMVKLTPNVTDITETARAAEAAGADCVSLINTLLGMKIDLKTRRPILRNNTGGLSGPAVKPVAVRMVWQTARAVNIPVVGMGGIMTGEDAAEFMLVGASAVQVGTAIIADPYAPLKIAAGLDDYLSACGEKSVRDIVGKVNVY